MLLKRFKTLHRQAGWDTLQPVSRISTHSKLPFLLLFVLLLSTPSQASVVQGLCSLLFASNQAEEVIRTPYGDRTEISRAPLGWAKTPSELRLFAAHRYGSNGVLYLQKLSRLGKGYENLITEAGLVLRVDEFVEFVKSQKSPLSPENALAAFREKLGYRIVYRGMALGPTDLKQILKDGMEAQGLRFGTPVETLAEGSLPVFAADRLGNHQNPTQDPLLSVSDIPALANAIASQALETSYGNFHREIKEERSVYLLKLRIPELDILHFDGNSYMNVMPGPRKEIGILLPNGQNQVVPFDRRVESFVLYRIRPEEIIDVREQTEMVDYMMLAPGTKSIE